MVTTQGREVPEDPADWTNEDIFYVSLDRIVEEGLLPRDIAVGLEYLASLEGTRNGVDYEDRGGAMLIMAAPHLHEYFAESDEAQAAFSRLEELVERVIFME